jgi:uncharacterized protein YjbJ (UPF0337 family)
VEGRAEEAKGKVQADFGGTKGEIEKDTLT